ncbi:MAG: type II toxin-antitoxin system HicB family antitoxin [Thermodesulfobacteriota bacterium]
MMEYKGYMAKVTFDPEAEVFHGEIINIQDVITFQGTEVSELRRALKDSVDDYLEFCASRGEEPEPPFSGRLTVQLSTEQHRKVVLAAQQAGQGIESWIAEALERCSRDSETSIS